MSATAPGAADVVAFWRSAGPPRWFAKDEAFDREIAARFADLHTQAAIGGRDGWSATPEGTLALVIVLDQFSRNLYRGQARAFAQDPHALRLARSALQAGFDRHVEPALRQFLYLPFMHSESHPDQERCVALYHALGYAEGLPFARDHERIIRRFGRFPHRNVALRRHTSPAERAFLKSGGFAG